MFTIEDFPIGSNFYWVRSIKVPHLKNRYVVYTKLKVEGHSPTGDIIYKIQNKKSNIFFGEYSKELYRNPKNSVLIPEIVFTNKTLNSHKDLILLLGTVNGIPLDLFIEKAKFSFKEFMEASKSPLFEISKKYESLICL